MVGDRQILVKFFFFFFPNKENLGSPMTDGRGSTILEKFFFSDVSLRVLLFIVDLRLCQYLFLDP